jgi:hypothetical protein
MSWNSILLKIYINITVELSCIWMHSVTRIHISRNAFPPRAASVMKFADQIGPSGPWIMPASQDGYTRHCPVLKDGWYLECFSLNIRFTCANPRMSSEETIANKFIYMIFKSIHIYVHLILTFTNKLSSWIYYFQNFIYLFLIKIS